MRGTSAVSILSAVADGSCSSLRPDHSDPSGLYSYRAQPSRVLWDLEKLVSALYPLIGYEAIHGVGSAKKGWSEGVTADDVEEWSGKGKEVMSGFEDKFYEVEREGERQGWMNVSDIPLTNGFAE